jgi:hypothetical protein
VTSRGPRRSVLCAEISNLLRRECRLLELLADARAQQRARSLHPTARSRPPDAYVLDGVLAELRWVELERAVLVQALAGLVGLDASASLHELATRHEPPWDEVLEEHRRALVAIVQRVDDADPADDLVDVPHPVVDLRLESVLHPPARTVGGRAMRSSLLDFLGETA